MAAKTPSNTPRNKTPTKRKKSKIKPVELDIPEELNFSEDLQRCIAEILPSDDPIDKAKFNATEYINSMFQDEKALTNTLDAQVAKLTRRINRIDEQIIDSVTKQSRAGVQGKSELEQAKESIKELFTKVTDIKQRAEESEKMVQEICSDIRDLDYAKKNLTTAIKSLEQINNVVQGLVKIRALLSQRQFKEVSHLFKAITDILEQFKDYQHVPKVKELNSATEKLAEELKTCVFSEFDDVEIEKKSERDLNMLADAISVVEALGEDVKAEFLSNFTQKILQPYHDQFKGDMAGLQYAGKRYTWFMNLLNVYADYWSKIFPESWNMREYLSWDFCSTTSQEYIEMLDSRNIDPKVFRKALKNTVMFEKELIKLFAKKGDRPPEEVSLDPSLNPHSAKAIELKYKRFKKMREWEEHRTEKPSAAVRFKHIISYCFDSYMNIYMEYLDDVLNDQFSQIMSQETWVVEETDRYKVLGSITTLIFSFSKRTQQESYLPPQAKLLLLKLYAKYLTLYASKLKDRLPRYYVLEELKAQREPLNKDEECIVCSIINTAYYCSNTTTKMEEKFKASIEAQYHDRISLEDEGAQFQSIIALAFSVLVTALEKKIEPYFDKITKLLWDKAEIVVDQSQYVTDVIELLSDTIPFYNKWIVVSDHFSFFCTTFVRSFIHMYETTIKTCKIISTNGTQQLLLDIENIKIALLRLPVQGMGDSAKVTDRYARRVKRLMGAVENYIKALACPADTLVDSYKLLIPDHSDIGLVKIMQLRGMKRVEMEAILDEYGSEPDSLARSQVKSNLISNLNFSGVVSVGDQSTIKKFFSFRGSSGNPS